MDGIVLPDRVTCNLGGSPSANLSPILMELVQIFLQLDGVIHCFEDLNGLDKQKKFSVNLYIFSYPSILTYILGAQKNRLIETVLLSTHNICFG